MIHIRRAAALVSVFAVLAGMLQLPAAAQPARPAPQVIVMASTTSTEQSGLFAHLLPAFAAETGIEVRVVAQGTGQALETARRGDADLVFVHDRAAEERFVAEGYGLGRRDVMYNDFVLVGPKRDPAGIAGAADAAQALARIARAGQPFVSRGDRSGTHAAELRLWQAAGVDAQAGKGAGWYRESGSGMGATLNIASSMDAYTLTDRGTWLGFRNRGGLSILFQGDPRLFNQYGVIVVDPARHPHVRVEAARRFADWVVSPAGQRTIASFRTGGEQAFFPNARP
jgi:tungstate transport system substrate-binding protein